MSPSEKSKCFVKNGDAVLPVETSKNDSNLYFSAVRVSLCATLILVFYNGAVTNRQTISAQYFQQRFIESQYNNKTITNITDVKEDIVNNAQKDASNLMMYNNIIVCITSVFTCLFAGSVSDFLGRKMLLLFSLSGTVMCLTALCVIIRFDLNIQLTFIGSVIDGILGSYFVTALAVTVIITDMTPDPRNRAIRFAVIDGISSVYGFAWQISVGYLIKATGFFVPVLVNVCHMVVSLLITIFFLPETLKENKKCTCNVGKHVQKTFSFYFSDVDRKGRFKFITSIAIYMIFSFIMSSRVTLEIMFTLNTPINWNSVDIGIFYSVKTVVYAPTAVVILNILKNRLSLEVTGIVCGISSAAGLILESFADSTLLMYLSLFLGMFIRTLLPLSRAVLSQSVSTNDHGAMFSSLYCIEAVAGVLSSTIFTSIYNATLETFRGAVFMIMAGMNLLIIALFGIVWHIRTTSPAACE